MNRLNTLNWGCALMYERLIFMYFHDDIDIFRSLTHGSMRALGILLALIEVIRTSIGNIWAWRMSACFSINTNSLYRDFYDFVYTLAIKLSFSFKRNISISQKKHFI